VLALKAGGTRFCVRDRGPLADPVPLLLVPDAGYSARVFAPLVATAIAGGRRVLAVDPPGFGGSRRAVRSLEPAFVAQQLEALIDALRVARLDLVGAGWGAQVVGALRARAPARVRALVAIEPDAPGAEPPPHLSAELRAELAAERAAAAENLERARAASSSVSRASALAWSDAAQPERVLDALARSAATG
jgi:pimeloyl-ACP methyl ester carboxylesterase